MVLLGPSILGLWIPWKSSPGERVSNESEIKRAEKIAVQLRDHLTNVPQYLDVGTPEAPTPERAFIQIVFLVNRQNYISLLASLETEHVIPAAHLARALLEESIRWEWMTDKPTPRMGHLFGEMRQSLKAITEECAAVGADPTPSTNPSPIGDTRTLRRDGPGRFPDVKRMLDEIQATGRAAGEKLGISLSFNFRALYAQYRVLSQFTHTSVLGMTATVQPDEDGVLAVGTRLPTPVRALIVHTAAASIANIAGYTAPPFFNDGDPREFLPWLSRTREIVKEVGLHAGPLHGLTP